MVVVGVYKQGNMLDLIYLPAVLGNNLRQLRIACDYTLDEISRRSGLSKSFLSMVESGKRSVKMPDLRNVLACYGYSLGRFLSEAHDGDNDEMPSIEPERVVQTPNHAVLLDGSREPDAYHLLLLRPLRSERDMEVLELFLPPCSQMTEEPLTINAEVRGIVQRGTLLIVLKGDEYKAREGEEFCYDGRVPHILRNYTDAPTVANFLVWPPVF